MDARTREQLRIVLSVTLALVPRWMKRAWAERIIAKSDPAKAQIVDRLITEVDRHFEITKSRQSAKIRCETSRIFAVIKPFYDKKGCEKRDFKVLCVN